MTTTPNFLIQLDKPSSVRDFQRGVGARRGIVPLGIDVRTFSTLTGIDALYMSFSRAERWGSRPLAPHTVALLDVPAEDQGLGYPPLVITGLVLRDEDPQTAEFCIPILIRAVLASVADYEARRGKAIHTVGLFQFELEFPHSSFAEIGKILSDVIGDAGV